MWPNVLFSFVSESNSPFANSFGFRINKEFTKPIRMLDGDISMHFLLCHFCHCVLHVKNYNDKVVGVHDKIL